MILATVCWSHWKERNKLIFNRKPHQVSKLIGEIKAPLILWISSKVKSLKLEWKDWREFKVAW
ncbi:hypothetical protein HanIR_Chr05g0253501 [Helianthus annuus]|nr:hypothetical protein HanIR_Chr05g0253501 [Helianthus annuus]